jgi:hypothetical protein
MKLLSQLIPISVVLEEIIRQFSLEDMHVLQSFDLQDAREFLLDPRDCACEYHGTDRCTCQYVVLLVSYANKTLATLVVHGHDDWTHITLVPQDDNQLTDEKSLMKIRNAILKFEQLVRINSPQRNLQEYDQTH